MPHGGTASGANRGWFADQITKRLGAMMPAPEVQRIKVFAELFSKSDRLLAFSGFQLNGV